MWLLLDGPATLQMRATAPEFNDATMYGPYCELLFFLMHHETDLTEPVRHVRTESLRTPSCTATRYKRPVEPEGAR